jgi:hypothetical protein
MSYLYSWPFSLLASCLLTLPPDTIQAVVISVIIRVPVGVLLEELALGIGLGIPAGT